MTTEEQRIAIAEACGWTGIEDRSSSLMMADGFTVFGYRPKNPIINKKEQLPGYPNSLDSMHEAEKILTDAQYWEYCDHLSKMCAGNIAQIYRRSMMTATASQRAEAFLRTLNLWKE